MIINREPRKIDEDDMLPIVERLARLLVVRETDLQDVLRFQSKRTKVYTEASARLDGAADAVYRVVNGWGPQQILEATKRAVGEVPPFTSQGRQAWLSDRTERLTLELLFIFRDGAE